MAGGALGGGAAKDQAAGAGIHGDGLEHPLDGAGGGKDRARDDGVAACGEVVDDGVARGHLAALAMRDHLGHAVLLLEQHAEVFGEGHSGQGNVEDCAHAGAADVEAGTEGADDAKGTERHDNEG